MRAERPRIAPTWLVLLLAVVVILTMLASSPRGGLQQRLASVGEPSDLSAAYLEAWSKVQPKNEEFLSLLGAQYASLGRIDDAVGVAERMEALGSSHMKMAAMMLRLSIAEQRTFAIPEDDPRRGLALASLREQLIVAARLPWAPKDLEWLAQRSAAVGLPDLALQLYTRLSAGDPEGRERWDTQITKYGLQSGDYHAAADAWFRQQAAATTRDEQRRCFIAGVRTLQSGNLLNEALTAADQHLGTLDSDPATLIVLLNLARAANRPARVDQYAKMLARYSQAEPQPQDQPQPSARAAYAYMDGPLPSRHGFGTVSMREASEWWGAPHVRSSHDAAAVHVIRVAASTATNPALAASASAPAPAPAAPASAASPASADSAPGAGKDPKVADLVFQSFVESGDLANALKIAQQQVQRDPRSVLWTKRLAQTAEWDRNPMLALNAWLDYAKLSNDPVGWQNVLRIAPMLDDDDAYLAALVHQAQASPDDLKLVDNVIATYERLGRPDDGLAFLRSLPRGRNADAIDQRIGALAERAGHDDQALAAYRAVQVREPGNAGAALRTASVLYRAGDYRASFAALQTARNTAKDSDTEYWRNYAELARLLQRDADASDAYRHLLAGGDATPEDLGDITYFFDPYPIDAGRVAELQYRRDHTPRALQNAIYYYTDAQALDRVAALLATLTAQERKDALASPGVLGVRAEYYRLTDQPAKALDDLKHAVDLPGATADLRAAYLWTLIDYGTDAELDATLKRWRGTEDRSAVLWEPYAAAEMRMSRPVRSLDYLRRQSASLSRDPLWLMTYADAEEAAGRPDLAWSIRHKVWQQLQQDEAALAKLHGAARAAQRGRSGQDAETLADIRGRRVTLSSDFETGDDSAAMLNDLLAGTQASDSVKFARRTLLGTAKGLPGAAPEAGIDTQQNNRLREAVAKDVAIAWALSHEGNPLAKRWLAQQYAARLAQPADARLTIALAENDTAAMEQLLAQERSRLPLDDRIDAAVATDRQGRAQQLGFEGLDGAPDNTDIHTHLTETALEWPQSLDASVVNNVEHPLDYVAQTLAGSKKIADHYLIGVTEVQNFQRSTDSGQLINVPSVDRSLSFFLQRQTVDSAASITAGRRDALASFYTLQLAAETGRNSDLQFGVHAGRNQVADEDQFLQVGGMKDNVVGDFTWRATQRITLTGSIEGDRFYSQARDYIGSGLLENGEITYRIRTDYPDYTVRLVGEHGGYGASGGADGLISRLEPVALQPALAGDFIPQSYWQYGMYFGFGNDLLDRYTHAWRPFFDIGILHNSVQGWGPDISLGIAGSVFGGDHLALYFEHQSVSRLGTPVTVVGARYNWFY
ncbi:hypothetical protein P3T43_004260 [Paraburkholderia sp. GAS41]|uniref:tetratricopeptide repeat protein n=1 Tax=Paraburkholderia sp. GAS41 TaxID=3035134 RepID=UPI003D1C25B8